MAKTQPQPTPAAAPAQPSYPCSVVEEADKLVVSFEITDPTVISRLKRRLLGVPLDQYIWENILKRAVVDHVY